MKLLLLIMAFLFQHASVDTEIELDNDHMVKYRSDQFTPGVISEFIEVTLTSDRSTVKKMEYWYIYRTNSGAEESQKWELEFKKEEQYDSGEEGGKEGRVQLPENEDYIAFRIAEGTLEISHSADQIQVFEINTVR